MYALAELGDERAIPILLQISEGEDSDVNLRQYAAYRLAQVQAANP